MHRAIIALAIAMAACGGGYNLPDGQKIYPGDYCPCAGQGWDIVCTEDGQALLTCMVADDGMCRWLPPDQGQVVK